MTSRRAFLLGAAAASVVGAAPPHDALAAVLNAVGTLDAHAFDPRAAGAASAALFAVPASERWAVLRAYVAATPDAPSGLFLVARGLVELPAEQAPAEAFPSVVLPGVLRHPALGAPSPSPPVDPRVAPQWPLLLASDVHFSLVESYEVGGLPEPLLMHLDALSALPFRREPLQPGAPNVVRAALEPWLRPASPHREALAAQWSRWLA